MGTPTIRTPQQGELISYVVGQPVSRGHGLRGVSELSFLLGFPGCHPIAQIRPGGTPQNGVTPVLYARNPCAHVLLIQARVTTDTQDGDGTVGVTASSGTVSWIGSSDLDGSTSLTGYFNDTIQEVVYGGLLNVSQLPAGTPVELRFASTSGGAHTFGISHLSVTEVPLAMADPVGDPADERGLDAAWPSVNGRLIDGDPTASPRGFLRWIGELDIARAGVKRHLQFGSTDNNGQAYLTVGSGTTTLTTLRVRARRLYETSVGNKYTFYVVYRTTNGTTAGQAHVTDGTNNATVTLTASTSRTVASASFEIITSGTDQLADLTFSYQRTSGAGDIAISLFCLLEAET